MSENTPAPLSEEEVQAWHIALLGDFDRCAYLTDDRHIPLSIIEEFQIGWDRGRYTFPIRDLAGDLVNVRRYKRDAKESKVISVRGYGSPARLHPLTDLGEADEWIVIGGGEIDGYSARAEGVAAIFGTSGEGSPPHDDQLLPLTGRKVAVMLDADDAGRKAAVKWASKLSGIAVEVRIVAFPREGMDLNDFIGEGTGLHGVLQLIEAAAPARARRDHAILLTRALDKVEDGEPRNDTGLWLACQMRDERYTEEEIWDLALAPYQRAVEGKKESPYTEAEARQTLDSIKGTPPRAAVGGDFIGGFPLTELGNAERLVAIHGEDMRWIAPANRWRVWHDGRWDDDVHGRVMALAKDSARRIAVDIGHLEDKVEKAVLGWAKASESRSRLENTMMLARSEPGMSMLPIEFDADPMLLNVRNGTLDLRTGKLGPHVRENYCRLLLDIDYDPAARSPRFDAFLARIQPDPEMRAFLQRAVGYSLTGSTAEQKLILNVGTGSNGKSTFIELMHDVVGPYGQFLPAEALVQRGGDRIPNDIARLEGARLVSVMEFDDSVPLNERLVKQLTGGDTISARFMRQDFFDFRPQATIWVSTNHHPVIRGSDDGIWRRFLLVNFGVKIPSAEIDRDLRQTLRDTERTGILRWAVEGALAWQREGLAPPAAVTAATDRYRVDSDVLGTFLEDECTTGTDDFVSKESLYAAYVDWCKRVGLRAATMISFGRLLRERDGLDLEDKRLGRNKVHSWLGVGLASEKPGFGTVRHLRAVVSDADDGGPDRGSDAPESAARMPSNTRKPRP